MRRNYEPERHQFEASSAPGKTFTPNCEKNGAPIKQARMGFTLFEILIVLGLSAIVMLMVGSALQIHLRITDSRGEAVRNAQLARVILRQISNDLRAATRIEPAVEDNSEDGDALALSSDASTDDSGVQIDAANQTIPGLYGDAEQIRIDILRAVETRSWFASVDAEATFVAESSYSPKPIGSLQTVAYFIDGTVNLSGGGAGSPLMDPQVLLQEMPMDAEFRGGLVRQVVDHPVASLALSGGGGAELDQYSEVFAREVISLTFRYYDGTSWYDVWDSYEEGGLPIAVEVSIGMATPVDDEGDATSFYQTFSNADSTFTMLVHLPTALPTDETEAQL